jgi:four helix bundle protein
MARSKASFVSKLSIVIEEADECCFWLEFIVDEAIIKENKITPLLKEAKELTAIFVVSRKTAKPREDN